MESQFKAWESVYTKQKGRKEEPQKEVVPLHDLLQNEKVQKILDLGCGGGRHLIYFAKLGYQVSGIDIAQEAVKLSQEWLSEENLKAELKCGDMIQLPWPDNFFDAVISIRVIEHNQFIHIQKIFKEVYRVMKNGAFLFANLKKYPPSKDWKKGKFARIDHHLYAPTEGTEKDIVHYFFTIDELNKVLANFSVIKIEEDEKSRHYCVLAKKILNISGRFLQKN